MPTIRTSDGLVIDVSDDISDAEIAELESLHEPIKQTKKSNLNDIINKGKKSLMEVGAIADTTIRGGVLGLPKFALEAGKALEEYVPESVRKFGNVPGLGSLEIQLLKQ